jgi:hypothetical protein
MNPEFAHAFSEIEGDVRDLAKMARLAEIQLHQAVGELRCDNGKYIEIPDQEATDLAIFAVSKMAEMAKHLEQLYDSFHGGAETARTDSRAA